jgi:membrane protein implicated in regulation of membrane protease activity
MPLVWPVLAEASASIHYKLARLQTLTEWWHWAALVAASLGLLRPRMLGWLGRAPGVPSRTDTLIGKQGQVTLDINPTLGTGRVNVAGEDWAARSTSVVAAGVDVRVVGADGIVLEVLPL